MSRPPHPIMRYQGGKYAIAHWIISFFPPHKIYLEPFGGVASVLLAKRRAATEIYNDLDSNIVNVFRVLQDRKKADELQYRLRHTPYSKEEFLLASNEREGKDDVETARRVIVRAYMGISSDGGTRKGRGGFGLKMQENGIIPNVAAWTNYFNAIPFFTNRLKGVVLENKDALILIDTFDTPDTLLYADPPYMPGTWYLGAYRHLADIEYHRALIERLKRFGGMVVLSGYENDLYKNELSDWECFKKETYNQKGDKRIECVWLNPCCVNKLKNRQNTLL